MGADHAAGFLLRHQGDPHHWELELEELTENPKRGGWIKQTNSSDIFFENMSVLKKRSPFLSCFLFYYLIACFQKIQFGYGAHTFIHLIL